MVSDVRFAVLVKIVKNRLGINGASRRRNEENRMIFRTNALRSLMSNYFRQLSFGILQITGSRVSKNTELEVAER